jgi:phosphoribosyl-AMP cyclohydrolase
MIKLDFSKLNGLIPAVVQDYQNGDILMLGFMNPEAWEATIASGRATFFSRTRNALWVKGDTSGNVQLVKEIRIDCDDDAVLLRVEQVGAAACHTGHRSCFFKKVKNGSVKVIGKPVCYLIRRRYIVSEKTTEIGNSQRKFTRCNGFFV